MILYENTNRDTTLKLLFLLFISLSLYADPFIEAETYFNNGEYEKAFPLFLQCTKKSKKPEAAYKLGWMYQNAKGVPLDLSKSAQWYKQAADWQVKKTNRTKLYETIFSNMDPLSDSTSTNTAVKYISGKFALRAHNPNYLLISYSDVIPKGEANNETYIQTEVQYQISLRADYVTNWFGFPQIWTGAYTQTSFWQLFIDSAPFRETNYKPEFFVTLPFVHNADMVNLKGIVFGYKHSSNGQPVTDGNRTRPSGPVIGSRSRSWNRVYTKAFFQWNNFFSEVEVWHRLSESEENDDNPDIEEYYGQGSIKVAYIYKKILLDMQVNPSISKGIASTQFSISYPTLVSENVYFYLKGFSGYGSSLIDYDQKVNKIGFGLSISR